jgi:NADPH-dependent 7-cyano-7-deazaguanine reductase QueF
MQPDARSQLTVTAAPAATAVVRLSLPCMGGTLAVSYVPDRLVLDDTSLAAYASLLSADQPEALVARISADIANELVPKWHRISFSRVREGVTHVVTVEDRQPGWTHPILAAAAEFGS